MLLYFVLAETLFYLSCLLPTRELIIAALDNLSAQLHYPSRFKVLLLILAFFVFHNCMINVLLVFTFLNISRLTRYYICYLLTSSTSLFKLVCAVSGRTLGPDSFFLDCMWCQFSWSYWGMPQVDIFCFIDQAILFCDGYITFSRSYSCALCLLEFHLFYISTSNLYYSKVDSIFFFCFSCTWVYNMKIVHSLITKLE